MPFVERNIGLDPAARQELMAMGVMSLPVICIGDRRVVGFNPAQIDEALAAG